MLFSFHTAWFSSSCPQTTIDLWKANEGALVDIDRAGFVFSDDAEAEDTKPLFESGEYKEERLTVFRSGWIERALCMHTNTDACQILEQYVLPPPGSETAPVMIPQVTGHMTSTSTTAAAATTAQDQQQHQQQQQQQQQQSEQSAKQQLMWTALGQEWTLHNHDIKTFQHVRDVVSLDAETQLDEFVPGEKPWRVVKA